MTFRASLERICRDVDGSLACIIMGFDGISVDHFTSARQEVDLQTLLIEYSNVMNQIRKATHALRAGALTEISIASQGLTALIRPITEEYFVALILRPEGNFGKGRFMLRTMAPTLRRELD